MGPLVSVIMAVHNSQKYLHACVKSILEQTLQDFEFVIINDASTDNSRAVMDSFFDSRMTILENRERTGLTKSLNIAIQNSKGRFIARMDADDIAHPDRLEKQASYVEAHPQMGVVGTDFYEIDENDKVLGELYLPEDDEQIRKRIFKFNPFFHSSVVIPRRVFERVGLYDEKFRYAQDYELWFRILEKYNGANLRDLLMKRRKHKDTLTRKNLRVQSYFAHRACLQGQDRIGSSPADRIWIFRHKILSKLPYRLALLFSRLRPHNLKYHLYGYYIRDTR